MTRPRTASAGTAAVGASRAVVSGAKQYMLALHTGKEVHFQKHVLTRTGFLAESMFLLATRARAQSTVSIISLPAYLMTCVSVAFSWDVLARSVSEACLSCAGGCEP